MSTPYHIHIPRRQELLSNIEDHVELTQYDLGYEEYQYRRREQQLETIASRLGAAKRQPVKSSPEENPVNSSDQLIVDAAVREAIAAPIRKAEIENRVAAVRALQPILTEAEPGTVIRFSRQSSSGETYMHVAIRMTPSNPLDTAVWQVTGSAVCLPISYSAAKLIEWMTTAAPLVDNVQIATEFTDVTWMPVPTNDES